MDNVKKKLLFTSLAAVLSLCTACGGSSEAGANTSGGEEGGSPVMEGSIEVAENLPDRDIMVPDYLKEEDDGDFEEKEIDEENTGQEEDEGETSYYLSGEEQAEKARLVAAQIEDSINQVLADKEHYPNVTGIAVNPECTEFNVTFSSQELSLYENVLHMSLCIVGNRFQLYQGRSEEELQTIVNYIDADSGEIFNTINSREIE